MTKRFCFKISLFFSFLALISQVVCVQLKVSVNRRKTRHANRDKNDEKKNMIIISCLAYYIIIQEAM